MDTLWPEFMTLSRQCSAVYIYSRENVSVSTHGASVSFCCRSSSCSPCLPSCISRLYYRSLTSESIVCEPQHISYGAAVVTCLACRAFHQQWSCSPVGTCRHCCIETANPPSSAGHPGVCVCWTFNISSDTAVYGRASKGAKVCHCSSSQTA